jgi:hypothetical protein
VPADYTASRQPLRHLEEVGVRHLFGLPGDYVLDFCDEMVAGPLQWVGTCNELNAGYATDGCARLNGAAAAVVTYGVGGRSGVRRRPRRRGGRRSARRGAPTRRGRAFRPALRLSRRQRWSAHRDAATAQL